MRLCKQQLSASLTIFIIVFGGSGVTRNCGHSCLICLKLCLVVLLCFFHHNFVEHAIATSLTNKWACKFELLDYYMDYRCFEVQPLVFLSGEGRGVCAVDMSGKGGGICVVNMSGEGGGVVVCYNSREGGTYSQEQVSTGDVLEDQVEPLQMDNWEPTLGDGIVFNDEIEPQPVMVVKVPAKHYANLDAPLHKWMGVNEHQYQ
ncbi:uncharacterized protein BJ212DRAFT_1296386 [Suillus subaureus]|uniref:Uncharacterized protein n=1 Tax=Suillus subaureus TaxID=48587 RepID=A0A9P7JIC1_9AGAM|nr:uncharacterized protein BJ212DRAFT_1296386 [Suillus subaureus]KAG1823859.1 hypothetical protein BJ212DRAFT_1296386 [Suillus subaureus]